MKTVRDACVLQPNALEINVGDQIEQLDQIISSTNGREYFAKTFITDGMDALLRKGISRLAGKSNDTVFHLKQAMGGGKTHLMVGFGLLAKDSELRKTQIGEIPYQASFGSAKVAAFNGRNNPDTYLWGEVARQLGREALFRPFWESGPKAPDESAWIQLFDGEEPILILLDEMPPYFHYYSTQALGQGTIADVVTRAFANMLTAAQKKKNVCIVVSDLEAAYQTGGKLIQRALDDATQEVGRAEVSITPVNLESHEIYEILRKRLFVSLPDRGEIGEIAAAYAQRLTEAAKAKTVERSSEAIASEIESTYPFHPLFQNLVALFKANEKFKQTRGLMELVSRLLKSVWNRPQNDVFLIGAQHFDLSIDDVREKIADISDMRDVIARDLWSTSQSAHAQVLDLSTNKDSASQVGTLLLTASLSTAVNSVKGLTEAEMLECLIDPLKSPSDFKGAFEDLHKTAWYMHQSQEGRYYFDRQENLTKKLQGYADKAPENKVEDLIRHRLEEMYRPTTKEVYDKVLPLPEMDDAEAHLKGGRPLLIISPDGKAPPEIVAKFFESLPNKNNLLVLTGERSQMASLEKAGRHVYASTKADSELSASHPQRKELDEKIAQYKQDFQTTVLNVFDKVLFPGQVQGNDILRGKALDTTYPSNEPYNGERQIQKTLTSDPIKLYTDVKSNFDALKSRAEQLLFANQDEVRKTDLTDRLKQKTQMPWLPPKGLDLLIQEACLRGLWEDLGNGYFTQKPKAKTTSVQIQPQGDAQDDGTMQLRIEPINAGNAPKVYYAEDSQVSEQSPILIDNILYTKALRVQFLVVDPTCKNLTGDAVTWENTLYVRNRLQESSRTVELFVAPRGIIKYTLDGSEPRNGNTYTGPISIGDAECRIFVFAEAEGLEKKALFTFPARNQKKVAIIPEKKATIQTPKPKKIDNTVKIWDGLAKAKDAGIEFENVSLTLGSGSKVIQLNMGEIRVKADFILSTLATLQEVIRDANAPILFGFKKAYFATGYDLEQFLEKTEMVLENDEVTQE